MTHNERVTAVRNLIVKLDSVLYDAITTLPDLFDPAELTGFLDNQKQKVPRLDEGSYCLCWRRQRCHLGPTTSYRLMARLLRRVDRYVSYDHLLRDVWDNRVITDEAVRSAVRELKLKLCRARMKDIAGAIRGCDRRYGLILSRQAQ